MNLSSNGAALIARFEGLRLEPYDDGVGVMTIGIGHVIKPGENLWRKITEQEAYDLFVVDAARYVADVNRLVKVPLTQNQFDALVSLDFNLGPGGWSGLLDLLNSGDYRGARDAFGRYVMAGGRRLAGLVRRRAAEADLFATFSPPVTPPSSDDQWADDFIPILVDA